MAPWTRKMVVEVMRNVRFVSGDESLVMDRMCDIRKQCTVEDRVGFFKIFTLCELWFYLLK